MHFVKNKNKKSGYVDTCAELHDEGMAHRVSNSLNKYFPEYEHWVEEVK